MYHISKDKRSEQSSEWVFDALKKLMAEKSFHEIKITDVVAEAKIGRTTFYRNFDTLDDVLRFKCDQEFDKCALFLKASFLEIMKTGKHAPFLLPFLQYWYINFSVIECLIKSKREDIVKESFMKMVATLRSEYSHIEIKYYNYFVEIRAAIAIALLSEWVRSDRQVTPQELVSVFEKQFIGDNFLFDLVK